MKQNQAQKSKRLALFTENEREYLRGKSNFKTVRKSQFHHNLDNRFEELLIDLELLQRSKNLKSWRSLRASKYTSYFMGLDNFRNLFLDIEHGYQAALRRVPKGKGKKKKSLFWLDTSHINDKIDERVFNSDHFFRRIRIELNKSDKELFLKAYHNQSVLPFSEDDAISKEEIKKRLSGESKIKSNETIIINPTPEHFDDPNEYEVHKIIEKHKKLNKKKLDKKLEKYGFKTMRYFVGPRRITENEQMKIRSLKS